MPNKTVLQKSGEKHAECRTGGDRVAYEFLKKGNYSASSGPVEVPRLIEVVAAADLVREEAEFQAIPEFAGLSVQSVGFEDGVDDPKVHIYLTRGSSRLIKELPDEVDGVPLRAHKMGPINVRPDSAAAATNRGNFYERNARVCCGSSCAPTSENCSGTLGALVRQHGARDISRPRPLRPGTAHVISLREIALSPFSVSKIQNPLGALKR
jgi:hypothetical protein